MRFEDFEILIARHGSDPTRWPAPGLAEAAHVREWLAAEREMEAALSPAPMSANFADRTLYALPPRRTRWPLMGGAVAAALMAAVFVYGGQPAPEDAAWSQLAETSGFGDLYNWVEG